ncbi:MAG TPA: response regulator transcription factor [Gammaproteobacteria bacterium]|nr:response regulator transcription factor [Gammaproteobacteria bacterium]
MRVLVIEDEQILREQLAEALSTAGYVIDSAADGDEGFYQGKEYPQDLAVVDLGLPGMSGIEVIKSWREAGLDFPVLILTARGRWQEKVEGLEAGADDYMVKPFSMEELQARVRALLRRSSGWSQSQLRCDPVQMDLGTQKVTVAGKEIDLTAYEYKVLEFLMLHAGEVISKNDLTEHIYHQDFDRDSNTLEVFVRRLRKKLDPDNSLEPIETLRGRGYRFVLERNSA